MELHSKIITVNEIQSQKMGELVSKLQFKESFLKRPFLSLEVNDELKAAMYYYAVGICHQTYHLANEDLKLYGWDFLEYGFIEIASQKPELLQAEFLVGLSPAQLTDLIRPFFAPQNIAENCTLDHLEERTKLWIDMAHFINKSGYSHFEYFQQSNGMASYFYEKLKSTMAYSDPLQKKTSFLMKILVDAHLIEFSNEEELIPIMDYHMQRVLMRTGCVEILDAKLSDNLQNRMPIMEEQELREACISSMKIIAKASNYSIFKMNDVFYTMGRSCCNESMLCVENKCDKEPCTLTLAIELENHDNCIFEEVCIGAKDSHYRKYWQAQIITHYY